MPLNRTPNPRYADLAPVVDRRAPSSKQTCLSVAPDAGHLSGFNLRKLEAALAAGRVHSRYQATEPYRRISARLLARALVEGGVDLLLLDVRDSAEHELCHITGGACPGEGMGRAAR